MSQFITNKGMGLVPDLPDFRDHMYKVSKFVPLPPSVDLRESEAMKSPILDQGSLGSCTANAIASAITYSNYKQKMAKLKNEITAVSPQMFNVFFFPSRLFIYYNERAMEGSINSDAGAQIRDGIKSVNRQGACREIPTHPYDIAQFTKKPSRQAYEEAKNYQALSYQRIDNYNMNSIKTCLAEGFPIVFGFSVYESFMSMDVAKTGMVPMPPKSEKLLGGHAVLMVGYDDVSGKVVCRNSWGEDWGAAGHFYLPYEYITNSNLTANLWVIKLVEV